MSNPFEFRFDPKKHSYFLGDTQLPGISWVLKDNGLMTEWSYKPEALRRGKWVHAFCQYMDEGDLDWNQVPDELMGYVIAWERYKKATGFVPLVIEEPRYHKTMLFAGTLDRDGIFKDNTRAIVEIKTGPIQPAVALQMAAQELLATPHDKIPVARRRIAVQLKVDGTFNIHPPFRNHRDANMFLSALAISNWRIQHGLTTYSNTRNRNDGEGDAGASDRSEAFSDSNY